MDFFSFISCDAMFKYERTHISEFTLHFYIENKELAKYLSMSTIHTLNTIIRINFNRPFVSFNGLLGPLAGAEMQGYIQEVINRELCSLFFLFIHLQTLSLNVTVLCISANLNKRVNRN